MWKLGRQLVAALSVAASTIVTGCSSVPRASPEADAEGKRFTPPPAGQGALYVYRGGVLGGAYVFPISAADRQLGTLPAGAWLRRDLEAGQYDVRCTGGENVASIVVPLAAGETRFVSVTTGVGWAAPRCGLAEVSAAEGRAGVLARRRIQEPAAVAAPRAIPSAPAVVSATSSASSSAVAAGLATSPASDPRREAARAGEAYHGGNYAEALKLLKGSSRSGAGLCPTEAGRLFLSRAGPPAGQVGGREMVSPRGRPGPCGRPVFPRHDVSARRQRRHPAQHTRRRSLDPPVGGAGLRTCPGIDG